MWLVDRPTRTSGFGATPDQPRRGCPGGVLPPASPAERTRATGPLAHASLRRGRGRGRRAAPTSSPRRPPPQRYGPRSPRPRRPPDGRVARQPELSPRSGRIDRPWAGVPAARSWSTTFVYALGWRRTGGSASFQLPVTDELVPYNVRSQEFHRSGRVPKFRRAARRPGRRPRRHRRPPRHDRGRPGRHRRAKRHHGRYARRGHPPRAGPPRRTTTQDPRAELHRPATANLTSLIDDLRSALQGL